MDKDIPNNIIHKIETETEESQQYDNHPTQSNKRTRNSTQTTSIISLVKKFVCLFVCVALRPMSTAMVIAGRSVH